MSDVAFHWWARQSKKHKDWMIRFGPLAALAAVVSLLWLYLNHHGEWATADRMLLKVIGIASGLSAIVSVLGARRWSLINLGLLSYLIADAMMLLRLFARVGPQPVSNTELNLIRSFFVIGAVAIIIALTAWMLRTRGGTRHQEQRKPTSGPSVQTEQPEVLPE